VPVLYLSKCHQCSSILTSSILISGILDVKSKSYKEEKAGYADRANLIHKVAKINAIKKQL
jgi:hypothetical protein